MYWQDGERLLTAESQLTAQNGKVLTIHERLRYDPAKKQWSAHVQNGAFIGVATSWTKHKWIFAGTSSAHGRTVPTRMVYTNLGDLAFRRDFQAIVQRHWRSVGGETCKRSSL